MRHILPGIAIRTWTLLTAPPNPCAKALRYAGSQARTIAIVLLSLLIVGVLANTWAATGTAVGDIAATMAAGTWATVTQTNINSVLGQGPVTGNQLPYAMSAQWDPSLLKLHFVGTDHGTGVTSYMGYDAATNSWTFFGNTPMTPSHDYDHSTLDTRTGTLYTREYGSNNIYKHPNGGSWSIATSWPVVGYVQVAIGVDWWSGSISGGGTNGNLAVYNCGGANGEVLLWNPTTNSWFANISGFGGSSTYHCFLEYSPVYNVAIFGGGNANPRKVWRLNSDRTVTAMPDAPMDLGIQRGNVTVDPVSGNFLVMGYGQLWQYDPRGSGQWTQQTGSRTPPSGVGNPGSPNLDGVISAPIPNYGVVMYVTCRVSNCNMYLYKHATGGAPSDTTPPSVSITSPAAGATVSGVTTVSANASDNVGVAGVQFKLDNQNLAAEDTSSPYSISWNTAAVTSGAHTLSAVARDAAGNVTSSSVSVTVNNAAPSFDFSMSNGGSQSATQGQAASNVVTATLVSGTSQNVSFSASGQPSGTSVAFSAASCAPNCSSTLTLTTAATTPTGTYTITVTGTSGSLARTTSFTLTVNPAGSSTYNFATLCAQPGVLKCVGFDAAADIAGNYGDNHGTLPGTAVPQLDTTVKSSGVSSLKFTIPSNSGANAGGSYWTNFSDDLQTQFGANSEFYVQWRQRFSPEFVTTKWAGGGGWKQAIIGTGDKAGCSSSNSSSGLCSSSCSTLETVTQNTYTRGFPQMYNSCTGSSSHGAYSPFEEPFGSTDFKLQNARPSPYCLYSQGGTNPPSYFPPQGNCFGYFANEWLTYQVHIKTGPRVNDEFTNSFVQLWIAREGQPAEMVFNWGPYNLSAGSATNNEMFGKVWLLPYNTGKDASVTYPTAYTWYDDLIISRQPISMGGGGSSDTTPPTVSITSPANGSTVSGTATTISATASDNVGVTGVQFVLDGSNLGPEDTTSPYSTSWNTTTASNGSHTLTAVARDAAGNRTTSAAVAVTVNNTVPDTTPPAVSITSPAGGSTVSGSTTVSANASDNVGVAGVQFLLDGANLGSEDTTSPYSVSWNTTTASAGSHTLTATARDAAGNRTTSAAVTVTVSDTTPPTVSITSPTGGSSVTGTTSVSANASDNVGVAGVQFKLDGNNLGAEDTSAPYSVSWTTTTATNGSHALTAVARDATGNQTISVSVTVTVSNDVTPPVISGVASANVTTNAATINWTSNEASDSQVEYGVTTSYGSQTTLNAAMVTAHSQALSGLTAGTTYNYRVKSRDASGNLAVSANFSFTTATAGARTIDIFPGTNVFGPAAQSLAAGDTLVVHQGTYNETNRMSIQAQGTSSSPITIKGAPGEARPIITRPAGASLQNTINIEGSATYLALRGLEIIGNGGDGVKMSGSLSFITLEDLVIHDIDVGIGFASTMNNITVRRNHIYNTGINSGTGEGMYVGCNDAACIVRDSLIEQNWIHDSLSGTTQGDGIEVKVGSYGNTIRDNVIYNRSYPGIFVYGTGSNPVNIVEGNVIWNVLEGIYAVSDAIVRNNIVIGSGTGLSLYPHNQVAQMKNVTAVNNTLVNNSEGVYMRWGSTTVNMVLANNAIYSPGATALNLGGSMGTFAANYLEGTSDRTADGTAFINGGSSANAFVNPAGNDFWPKAGSPLLNTASGGYAPGMDFNQTSRVAPFEVGAYETNGAAANPGWAITAGFKNVTPAPAGDTTPPVIAGVATSNITANGATVTWTTDEPADSQVEYGTSAYTGSTGLDGSQVTKHSQVITGLTPGTTYNYRVKSADAAGNAAASANFTFTTILDSAAPVITNVSTSNLSSSAVTITWTTNERSDSQVEYTALGVTRSSALDTSMTKTHRRRLTGLLAGTTYTYRVKSRDADGNLAVSPDFTFTTPGLRGAVWSEKDEPVAQAATGGKTTFALSPRWWFRTWPHDRTIETAALYVTDRRRL